MLNCRRQTNIAKNLFLQLSFSRQVTVGKHQNRLTAVFDDGTDSFRFEHASILSPKPPKHANALTRPNNFRIAAIDVFRLVCNKVID